MHVIIPGYIVIVLDANIHTYIYIYDQFWLTHIDIYIYINKNLLYK